jgi:hypothetical protein
MTVPYGYSYHFNGTSYSWKEEYDDFVEAMNSHCPKLREIEFGMFVSSHIPIGTA